MREMDPNVNVMYEDAMTLMEISVLEYESALNSAGKIALSWERFCAHLRPLIVRLGKADIQAAKNLLSKWENVGAGVTDYRRLTSGAVCELRPLIQDALSRLYPYVEMEYGRWMVRQTPSAFFTVVDRNSGRGIHSLASPMQEAFLLANELYSNDMEEFHMLGCGLGYLAYQLWIKSEKTLRIHIYEEDEFLCEVSFTIGVLSWIDDSCLVIEPCDDKEDMVRRFLVSAQKKDTGVYVQDWKEKEYHDTVYGDHVDNLSYNMRLQRTLGTLWKINERENRKIDWKPIRSLSGSILNKSKDFVVVSAGPSLDDNIDFIKQHSKDMCIIAINASLRRLASEGIRPDIAAMLDPQPWLAGHLEGIAEYTKDIPLVTVLNGCQSFNKIYQGPKYLIEGTKTDGFEWQFEGTVASLALDLAFFLGAQKIYIIGSDLGFPENRNYAKGLVHNETEGMSADAEGGPSVEAVDGQIIRTTVIYEMYRKTLEKQIRSHPSVKVYNMSQHGAKIEGTLPVNELS